jgi:hypothetical protein
VKFISHPLIVLMLLGILAKLLVGCTLFCRCLAVKYPGVLVYLLGGALRSSWLIWCGVHSPTGYHDAWIATQWVPIILLAVLLVQCHWSMAGHFRNVRWFALISLGAYLSLSLMAVGIMNFIPMRQWAADAAWPIQLSGHVTFAGMIVLALARHYWYDSPTTQLCRNVRLLVDSLFIALAVEWLAVVVIRGLPLGRLVWVAEYAIAAVPVALSAVWWTLRPSGEQWMRPEPIAAGSTNAADEELRWIRDRMK